MSPVRALQEALAGEHAAVYLFGVLGGQVSRSEQAPLADLISTSYATHIARRDELNDLVSAHHHAPVAAAPAYRIPGDVGTTAGARALALRVEERCLALYGQTVESTTGTDRAWAITALRAGAVDVMSYGARPTDFPGMTWS
ncbi:MAG TPA: ferritin-like domain-containing protein [Marmoricola sp.]